MTTLQSGDTIPAGEFMARSDDDWLKLTTNDIFSGKTVVVFAVPGAFTPTCSLSHLPGYMDLKDKFADNGVDAICCLAVNDGFVLKTWAEQVGADGHIKMLPDGSASFTKAMGLDRDMSHIGFGTRSARYSMLVKDSVIAKIFVESDGEFKISDAQTMLTYITS